MGCSSPHFLLTAAQWDAVHEDLKSFLGFLLSTPPFAPFVSLSGCECYSVRSEITHTHTQPNLFCQRLTMWGFLEPLLHEDELCPMSPLKCLNPFAPCARRSLLTSVKIKMLLSGAPTSPAFSFVYLYLHVSLFPRLSPPLEPCVSFLPSCGVFFIDCSRQNSLPDSSWDCRALQLRLPPPRTILSQDTRHQRNTICLISPPALQSAPLTKIGFTAQYASSGFVLKLQNAPLQAQCLGTQG